MSTPYTFLPNLADQEIPGDGILSRTIQQDDHTKVVVFGFAAGQELSEHTAAVPALLSVIKGEASITLGADAIEARAGAWIHMPAHLRHAIRATTPLVLLLVLLKGAAAPPRGI